MFLPSDTRLYHQMVIAALQHCAKSLGKGVCVWGIVCMLYIAATLPVAAQYDIVVTTQITPPYSPYLSDYVSFENKMIVTLFNTKQQARSVRLVGALTGENGIDIRIPKSFKPAHPIVVGAGQSVVLMGLQLKEYVNPDVLSFSGISKQDVVQGNGLPEGNYSFCIQALDYNSGQELSAPAPLGCASFAVTHYEPPVILQPQCDSEVQALQPQNLVFSWTIPAGAPPQKIEYYLRMVEVFSDTDNPNQALLAAGNPPFFETVVQSPSFLYGPAAPKLQQGMRYAFQVTARNKGNSKELTFKNQGKSVACSFVYGKKPDNNQQQGEDNQQDKQQGEGNQQDDNNQQANNNVDEDYVEPCEKLSCAPQPLATGPAGGQTYHEGDEIKIGYFVLKLTKLTSASANSLSGEGVIDAPVFRTKLKATFQNLQVNAQHKVFAGKAIGAYDPGAIIDNKLKDFTDNVQNIAGEHVKAVADYVKSNQKYIENFVDVETQGLPFAWKKPFGAKLQLVNIASVEFAPDGARFNAFLEFPIPEANNKIVAFGQKNVCFHPTGMSIDGLQKLTMLGNDVTMPWGENIDMVLKAANGNEGTYVRWGCEGFVSMQLDGEFVFKGAMLEKTQGQGPVKATFTFKDVGVWGDVLGKVSMDEFSVKGLKGLSFAFNDVVLDFSDTRNAQGMAFPANYIGGKGNDWRGFYFKNITVTLPSYLRQNKQPVKVSLQDALINKLGFTGKAVVQPVFDIGKGDVGGWAFSMEKLTLDIVNNSLAGGGFNGKLKLPVAKTELAYTCLLSNAGQELTTAFEVENVNDLNVDMWAAMLQIDNGSSIAVDAVGNDVTVKAVLSGSLTIDDSYGNLDFKGLKVNIPDVEFKDFTIQNKKPYITAQYFKFASPQKTFAGFPISIDAGKGIPLKIQDNGSKVGLELNLSIGLDGNGESAISGGTAFTVWAKEKTVNGKQTWVPDKPTLDSIGLHFSVAAVDVEGSINIYKGDEVFGDGFRGTVKATFRSLIELGATIQFGSTGYKSNSTYRYWYVDAMAKLETGIPVFPGFGIYGFGGGAYYHMEPPDKFPDQASLQGGQYGTLAKEGAGQTNTGVVYTPNKNILFGCKANIVIGTMPKPNAFNGDIGLEMSFTNNGLNKISLTGKGYFVQPVDPSNRPGNDAVVVASVVFEYSTQKKSFDGLIDIQIHLKAGQKSLLEGGGAAALHFSKNKWFIKLGTPDERIGLQVLGMIDIDSYLMVGKNSLGSMPPLPTTPINFLAELPSFNDENPRKPAVNNGSGFALGQQISVDTGKLKFLIFYARIALAFGYDISILDLDQSCEFSNGKMGLNGWYATGQVYSGIEAAVGLDINLWFIKADVELFEVGLYAALKAGLPNPTWVKGQVAGSYSALNGALSGHCTFKFQWGNYCDPNDGDPFGGLKVISEIVPSGGNADVFSFPEVSFNLPVGPNEIISVNGVDGNGDPTVSTFRFGVRTFEVREKNGNANAAGTYAFASKNMSAVFTANEMLKPHTAYTTTVEIYGDRRVKGQWERIKKCNGCNDEHTEKRTQVFTTGEAPETFLNSNIVETRPGRMQRYYPYGMAEKHFIRFRQYPSNIPTMQPKDKDYKYEFVARFQELGAGSQIAGEKPIEWVNDGQFKGVRFDKPTLKKETVYIVQIVRKKVEKNPPKVKGGMQLSGGSGNGNVEITTVGQNIGDGQHISVRRSRLKAIALGDNEFLVYQLAFRTSKHATYKNKYDKYLANSSKKLVKKGEGAYDNTVYAQYAGDEAPDWYDLHQSWYMTGSIKNYVEPMISAEAVNKAHKLAQNAYWSWLYYDYYKLWYENTYFRNLLSTEVLQNKTNPRTLRAYPSENAYTPGSRLTNNTSIPAVPFPIHAVDLSYQGNGASGKLTNQEINAVYWKGLGDEPDNNTFAVLNKLGVPQQPKGGVGMQGGNGMIKQNELHYLVVRYDAGTVLQKDREKLATEMLYRYGLNASFFSLQSDFWSFMRHNAPKSVAQNLGLNPPYNYDNDYLTMDIKQNTELEVEVQLPGIQYTKTLTFKLSD